MMKLKKVVLTSVLLLVNTAVFAAADEAKNTDNQQRNAYFKQDYAKACTQFLQSDLQLPATTESAAQHEINVNVDSGYRMKMNEDGVGYLQLAITEWNEKLVLFSSNNMKIAIKGADITGANIANLACEDEDKQITHVNTHEWGSYIMTLTAAPNSWVELAIVKEVSKG
ncbi:hypothetical protein [Moritella sp. Urea-trap-13]|uniref:hypothetical protein n=1 Tax=Moritella sp. Urea-trap-13 TaxID=2058327 RepID=UPI000C34E1FC|nr:hypothetical protein [Moritella sp. Urea-trap-13]PKH04742.1 hypothetical protein CXF93_21235 [Moritella sp. Urea-trap-13]